MNAHRVAISIVLASCTTVGLVLLMRAPTTPTTIDRSATLSGTRSSEPVVNGAISEAEMPSEFAPAIELEIAAALEQVWDEPEADIRIAEMLERWARTSPEAALQSLRARPAGSSRTLALMRLAAAWAETDPRAAGTAMLGIESPEERERSLGQVVATWSASDPEAAIDWLRENVDGNQELAMHLAQAYSRWAGVDSPTAARDALDGSADPRVINSVLAAWAAQDPAEAYDFFSDYLTSNQQEDSINALLLAAATSPDTTIATKLIDALVGGSRSTTELVQLGKNLAEVDPSLASRFADRLPEGPEKAILSETLQTGLASNESRVPDVPGDDQIVNEDELEFEDVVESNDSRTDLAVPLGEEAAAGDH